MSLGAQLKSILKHGSIYGISRILSRAAGFLMIPVYTRFLDPQGYGILELLDLTLSVMGLIIANGINSSIFKFYYKHEGEKERHAVVSTAILCVAGLGLACGLGVLSLSGLVSSVLFGTGDYARLVAIAACTFVLNLAGDIPMGYLRAKQRSLHYSAVTLSRLVLELSGNILFVVVLEKGVAGILYTQLISAVLYTTYLLLLTFRETGVGFSSAQARLMLAFGLPLIPSSIGMFIINYGDRYFLKHFTTLEEVGVYSLGFKFGYMLSYLVMQPFMLIWDAKMYEIARQPDAPRIYGRIFTYLVAALAFVALGMALFIGDFVELMADRPFWKAAEVVPLILLAYVFQGFYYFFQVGLYLKDKTKLVGAVILGTSLATLALQYLLIRQLGSLGAAAAAAASYFTMSALMFAVSQKVYPVAYEFRRVAVLFAAALGLYALYRAVEFESAAAGLAWSAALALAFPFLLYVLRFFHPEEIAAGKGLVASRFGSARFQKGVAP